MKTAGTSEGQAAASRTSAQRRRIHATWNWYFIVEAICVVVADWCFTSASMGGRLLSSLLILVPCLYFMVFVLGRVYDRPYNIKGPGLAESVSKTGARGWVFALLTLVLLPVGAWFDGVAILAQLFVVPQLFIAFSYLPALGLVGVLNGVFLAMAMAGVRFLGADLAGNLMLLVLLVVFSAMIGKSFDILALTNGHNQVLLDQLESQQETIRRLSLAEGASLERERVAGEVHDTIAQSLASVLALARVAREELKDDLPKARRHLDMIADLSQGSLDDTRRIIADSAPADLEGKDLNMALTRTVQAAAQESGFQAQCHIQQPLPPLPRRTEVNLLRIVQEALANTSKHAEARHVHVNLEIRHEETQHIHPQGQSTVQLLIQDDGLGFDTDNLDSSRMEQTGHGYGLRDMAKRAKESGGTCTVTSRPGQGTRIAVTVPADVPGDHREREREQR